LITDYLDGLKVLLKPKKKTGRGNRDEGQIEKVKEFLRKQHPYPVRQNEVARFVGCEQARAGRLLDLLSGVSGDKNNAFDSTDFLVGVNDERKPITYFIFKDRELGIEP
ncbi:MAG: hypothetical protein FWF29_02285, partial [Treponema sp.]|nr:hypothetical protein [Treponema sp.]